MVVARDFDLLARRLVHRADGSFEVVADDPPDGDARDPYQRDRDRILYSREFSRLASVTQVVSPRADHQLHNRLTHSLKVAQVGRRLAEHPRINEQAGDHSLDEDAVEAACLAHDLGHPPFGHVGETTLDRLSKSSSVPRIPGTKWVPCEGFEGNAQSLRIAIRLGTRGVGSNGERKRLDLTLLTLNGIVKYPWTRHDSKRKLAQRVDAERKLSTDKKFGVYSDDEVLFEEIRRHHVGSDIYPSLEASVMEVADDITYAVHDLMDFYRAGFVPLAELLRNQPLSGAFVHLWEWVQRAEPETDPIDLYQRLRAVFDLITRQAVSVPDVYAVDPMLAEAYVADATGKLISICVDAVNLVAKGDGLVAAFADDEVIHLVDTLQALTKCFVIESPALGLVQAGQQRILEDIFVALIADAGSTQPRLLPEEWRVDDFKKPLVGDDLTRAVRDYVASLSEAGARSLHSFVTGATSESIFSTAFGQRIV